MADPHGGGDHRGGGLEKERPGEGLGGGVGVVAARCQAGVVPFAGEEISSDPLVVSELRLPVPMEEGGGDADSDRRDVCRRSEETGSSSISVRDLERDVHGIDDLVESRALQADVGMRLDPFEISRAISNMVGLGTVDRHYSTWGRIALILASIPGAQIAIDTSTPNKLKSRDYRKIHFQDTLSLNSSSIPKLAKPSKPIFSTKAAKLFLPSPMPKISRPSRPSKTSNTLLIPNLNNHFPSLYLPRNGWQ